MEEEIEITFEDWEKFYESQGSKFFQLESEILGEHGGNQKKLLYEVLTSTTQLIQVIGVVAGFGFTGLGYVKNLPLFIFGEALLFCAIFIGLLWTQKIYRSNLKSTDKEVERVKSIFKTRYETFKKIYDKAVSYIQQGENIKIPRSLMSELIEKNNDLMEQFKIKEIKKEEWDPLSILMILFVAGGFSLLISFVNFCILN
ncbi:MAG: hypothetical protein HYW34_00145 [Candidatus Brennerbacteria bacterium]|nr:hypothetical protein [Candidatus Brennerbacteria bacterium]